MLEKTAICQGLSKEGYIQYVKRHKGKICNIMRKKISAYLDETLEGGMLRNDDYPQGSTVRVTNCSLIVVKEGNMVNICKNCRKYERHLSTMAKRPIPGIENLFPDHYDRICT